MVRYHEGVGQSKVGGWRRFESGSGCEQQNIVPRQLLLQWWVLASTAALAVLAAEMAIVPRRLLKATTTAAKEKGDDDHGHQEAARPAHRPGSNTPSTHYY